MQFYFYFVGWKGKKMLRAFFPQRVLHLMSELRPIQDRYILLFALSFSYDIINIWSCIGLCRAWNNFAAGTSEVISHLIIICFSFPFFSFGCTWVMGAPGRIAKLCARWEYEACLSYWNLFGKYISCVIIYYGECWFLELTQYLCNLMPNNLLSFLSRLTEQFKGSYWITKKRNVDQQWS